jgi:hypothetical protein
MNPVIFSAPARSHVKEFSISQPGRSRGGGVWLRVTFKANRWSGESTYEYLIPSRSRADSLMLALRNSIHPGVVIHRRLRDQYEYRKIR